MKRLIFVLMISIVAATGWSLQKVSKKTEGSSPLIGKTDILDFYRRYSSFTDPGEYAGLYKNLPDSLTELCNLIKNQFLHPYAELPQYRHLLPRERWNESFRFPTVQSLLKGLLTHDSRGLVRDRKPGDRLVLGCRENAILLASVMKYRGIPARIRSGHATYIIPGFHASHTICEVWDEKEGRWLLVDPSMERIDFNRDQFDFSNELWLKMQRDQIDPAIYGNPGQYTGLVSIVGKVCHDLASILGNEYPVYQYAPVLDYAFRNGNQLAAKHIETLNRVSELMKSIDAGNLSKLQEIYNRTPFMQMTMRFEPSETKAENSTNNSTPSTKKPEIEFVDIPGGTFLMGSLVTEPGRKEDEIRHEVTLSAFKMSKYCVTYEQYDRFCEATGRKKTWGMERGKNPVSQVSWHDAAAFAEWMGCRLPTEAEWEYAARAGTTTPFNTGDSLTSEQANFNNQKPLPVGSFPPNAFGLHDMHGNIWEWTNDWYGEYDIGDKLNPKGPKTGTKKVNRGGGFRDPAWRCRSACRGGDHPESKGMGIGFRLVKSE